MEENKYFQVHFKEFAERDKIWKVIAGYLQSYISPSSNVLDLGAAYCSFINNIKAKEKYAIDLFENIEKYASKDVFVYKQSITQMDNLKSCYFDVIFASNIFEHLSTEELQKVISQIKRILKKDGKLIIMQPNFKYSFKVYFNDYTHKQIFTACSLSALLESLGFDILVRKDRFLPFSMNSGLPKAPFLVKLYLRSPIKPLSGQMLIVAGLKN
jgi:SAM-dependent methyltransferase